MDASEKTSRGTCDKYIEVINEIEKLDEIIKHQDIECVVIVC